MLTEHQACVAIGSTTHGKWSYRTVVIYRAGAKKDGKPCWLKGEVVCEATTRAKIARLAAEVAAERALPLMPGVRHFDVIQGAR